MNVTPSRAVLLKAAELPVHDRGGGARTTPLVGRQVGAQGFLTGYTEFAAGAQIPFHFHNCEESVVLIEGEAMLDIDGESHPLKAHDATYIPPGVPHRFRNLSATRPMKILWIYGSPDATRSLVETGETRPIAAEHGR